MFSDADVEIFSVVFANEKSCREFLREMIKKGVTVNVDIESLTHKECITLATKMLGEVVRNEKRREQLQRQN